MVMARFKYGTFYQVPDTGTAYLVVGDFNGDGIPDVAATGASGVWLFTGKGDGTLNPGVLVVSLPTEVCPIAATDFNGDGNLDLVVTVRGGHDSSGSGFAVLLGNGDGSFQAPTTFAEPKTAAGLAVGPLTKGGPPGIVLSAGS
jgi:hypothetical protein